MLDLIRRYSKLYRVEILGFCLRGNHFHILVRMFPEHKYTDEDIQKRYENFYGDGSMFEAGWIPSLREKLSSLSEFVREIKVGFARFYNKWHNRRGYFWGDRFKSVIVEKGETPVKFAALVFCEELNGVNPDQLPGLYRLESNTSRSGGTSGGLPLEFDWVSYTDGQ